MDQFMNRTQYRVEHYPSHLSPWKEITKRCEEENDARAMVDHGPKLFFSDSEEKAVAYAKMQHHEFFGAINIFKRDLIGTKNRKPVYSDWEYFQEIFPSKSSERN